MNVVRERELGTIEQINVTPIKKYQFIIGKLLPFLFIGLFDLALGLAFAKLLFNIPMVGSLWLVFAFCVVNIIAILGVGLFISTTANTQQQAMFVAFFFMMIFLLMGGLFTPLESMPEQPCLSVSTQGGYLSRELSFVPPRGLRSERASA